MLTRRAVLTAAAAAPALLRGAGQVRLLEPGQVPGELARQLGLDTANWEEWRARRREAIEARVVEGSAEHIIYYVLQSSRFTGAPPLVPVLLARDRNPAFPQRRADDFLRSAARGTIDERHKLICELHRQLPVSWTLEKAFRHTMDFLRAKEIDQVALDQLYFRRGLSSDTAPESTRVFDAGLGPSPRRILLAGPGLDLTRRERFSDSLPLHSHQLEALRQRFPQARIDTADIRPEVIGHLGAMRVDVTSEWLAGPYDLIVATNLLLYFEDRELLTAMAGFARSLTPGGRLLHNDQRFGAKVFGDALGMPVERYAPVALALRRKVERMDRAVIHIKGKSNS